MSEKLKTMVLEGRHPYAVDLGASIPVEIWSVESTKEVTRRDLDRTKGNGRAGWISIAGYFELGSEGEMFLLMGLLWDLEGYPMFPGRRSRRRATYRVVEVSPGQLMVYLSAAEYRDAFVDRDGKQADLGASLAG